MSENSPTMQSVIRKAVDRILAELHTAMPGKVVSYNSNTQRASVKPLLKRARRDENDKRVADSLSIINEVPILFQGAGGSRIKFPINVGDIVLLIFCEGSIDKWLSKGGEVDPIFDHHHSLDDAIAIPGLLNKPSDANPQIEFTNSQVHAGGSAALALAAELEELRSAIAGAASGNAIPGIVAALGPYGGTSVLKGS